MRNAHPAAMQALLGDVSSRRSLRSAIHHFVSLRRYEQMSVHQAMQGIKLSTVTAISSHSRHSELTYLPLSINMYLMFTCCYLLLPMMT